MVKKYKVCEDISVYDNNEMDAKAWFGYEKDNGKIEYNICYYYGGVCDFGTELAKLVEYGGFDGYEYDEGYRYLVDMSRAGIKGLHLSPDDIEEDGYAEAECTFYDGKGIPKTANNRSAYIKSFKKKEDIKYLYLLTAEPDDAFELVFMTRDDNSEWTIVDSYMP